MSQATLGGDPYRNSNLFAGYYLDERVQDLDAWDCDEAAEAAFAELQRLWDAEESLVDGYNETDLLGQWIDEVLDVLGFDSLRETPLPDTGGYIDRTLYGSREDRADAAGFEQSGMYDPAFGRASALLEAKQWDESFATEFADQRNYRNASQQIKYYLENTPDAVKWGVLTNGRKWRLYGTKDYKTETYYEVDLPELLASGSVEVFKYFYVFFRAEAFREVGGTTFHDEVYTESETAAQELGEDLQDNVFTALRVLGEGFLERNDLEIESGDEEALAELKEQSLVLLYRLMFVLYAESRGLISPEDPDARDEYQSEFSLNRLRREVYDTVANSGELDGYSRYSPSMWASLQKLFELIDEGNESLGIPPYNGGLFDQEDHEFLTSNGLGDYHVARVLYEIGTTESESGEQVMADYADLDTRHLGSIYEGLLEHEFRIAPEEYAAVAEDGGQVWKSAAEVADGEAIETVAEGELYVVNDEGERKATGAYYTPDYVVTYIVEETIDPLIDEIDQTLRARGLDESSERYFDAFCEEILDLTILDPAMGSGHFLTKATGYLTEHLMEAAREGEETDVDEQVLRRRVSKECIYGVDVNGMAVELAKLSMWLETLAANKPLAFLDHHLKTGNSLVGSDITEVLADDDGDAPNGQMTFADIFEGARRDALDHVMDRMSELLAIENDALDDIKEMEATYAEVQDDPLYGRLRQMANVHTAERFGLDVSVSGGQDVYEQMARAITDAATWTEEIVGQDWFETAQVMAREEGFFHWELEYPAVFFDADGEKRGDAGFDAVVANPPYVSNWELTETDENLPDRLERLYPEVTYGHWDLFVPFTYKISKLASDSGQQALITPNSLGTEKYGMKIREYLIEQCHIRKLVQFHDHSVFNDVDRQYLITVAQNSSRDGGLCDVVEYTDRQFRLKDTIDPTIFLGYSNSTFRLDIVGEERDIKQNVESRSIRLGHLCVVNPGVVAHSASDSPLDFKKSDVISEQKREGWKKYISGGDIYRYRKEWKGKYMDYDSKREHFHRPKYPALFESPKIMFSGISGESALIRSTYDEESYYTNHNVLHAALLEGEILNHHSGQDYEINPDASQYDLRYIAALVNSSLLNFYFKRFLATGTLQGSYSSMYPEDIRKLPIYQIDFENKPHASVSVDSYAGLRATDSADAMLAQLTDIMLKHNQEQVNLNTDLSDYLGSYSDGQTLADIGLTQPPRNAADSILQQTTEQYPNLRVGTAMIERESDSTVTIHLTARYKPEESGTHDGRDPDTVETDSYGYRETDPIPALRITDLTETEADLIESFVPYAVDEAGGFADFRENATKTNSLVDRLRALRLPRVADVERGLESYRETVERAEELDRKIERTDELIDEIVYDLYGLTDEEIAIVEDAVGD